MILSKSYVKSKMMYWKPWKAGLALGGVFLLAVLLVTPIGVSTQFVVLNGVAAKKGSGRTL